MNQVCSRNDRVTRKRLPKLKETLAGLCDCFNCSNKHRSAILARIAFETQPLKKFSSKQCSRILESVGIIPSKKAYCEAVVRVACIEKALQILNIDMPAVLMQEAESKESIKGCLRCNGIK